MGCSCCSPWRSCPSPTDVACASSGSRPRSIRSSSRAASRALCPSPPERALSLGRGLGLYLAEVDRCARTRRLGGIHLLEDRTRVAHLLLSLEVPDEDGRPLSRVDEELKPSGVDSGRRPVGLLDLGGDLADPLRRHVGEPDDTRVHLEPPRLWMQQTLLGEMVRRQCPFVHPRPRVAHWPLQID